MKTLKIVMSKCEELKKRIRVKYSEEYQVYLANVEEERRIAEENNMNQ